MFLRRVLSYGIRDAGWEFRVGEFVCREFENGVGNFFFLLPATSFQLIKTTDKRYKILSILLILHFSI
jgi:hypothetical protein